MSAEPSSSAPSLLATVVAALFETGRVLDVDWDLATFDVLPRDGVGEPLLGVVMSYSRAVAFYRVYPSEVPGDARSAVMEHVTRQNTMLGTSAFELDLDTGTLSLRTGFALPDVELDLLVLAAILTRMIAEVDSVHARTHVEIESLLAQASDAPVSAAPVSAAPVSDAPASAAAPSTTPAGDAPSGEADRPISEDHA